MARVTLSRTTTADTTRIMVDKNDDRFTFTMMFTTLRAFLMLVLTFMMFMFIFTVITSPNDDLSAAIFPATVFRFIAALITHSSFHLS